MVELVAHRGAPSEHPENSMAGFQKAYDLGVRILELDVQMTHDKELVVFHDRNTMRMTGFPNIVEKTNWKDLATLPLLFDDQSTTERIPRLQDVLARFQPLKDVQLIIDCKTECQYKIWRGMPSRIYSMVTSFGMEDRVMFAAGTPWTLAKFRVLSGNKARTILNIPPSMKFLQRLNSSKYVLSTFFVDEYSFPLDCEIPVHVYDEIKRRGGKINAWSLYREGDDASHVDQETFHLLSRCVDRIMTDDIRRTLKILAK